MYSMIPILYTRTLSPSPSLTHVLTHSTGFRVWTFQGQLLAHVEKGQFYQFSWRPRPPPLLTPEQQRKVKKGTYVPLILSLTRAHIRVGV